jgi:hypothetical protein
VTAMTQTWRMVALDPQLKPVTQVPLDRHGAEALAMGWTFRKPALTHHERARLGRVVGQDVQMPPAGRDALIVALAVLTPAGDPVAVRGLNGEAPAQEGGGVTAVMPPLPQP